MLSIDKCPVCGNSELTLHLACRDTTVSQEIFTVFTCKQCGLGITTPRPNDSVIESYYQSDKYISHSGSNGLIGHLYKTARKFTLDWKRSIVEKYCTKGTILDFGCGTGDFLNTMKKDGWNIVGIEPSATGRKKSEELTGTKILSGLTEFPQWKLDAITLWHVLEHVPELRTTLETFHQLLAKNGLVFIAVPNYQSADATYYGQHWAGYDVPRHLWHFTKESMKKLLKETGFSLKEVIPMKLDAYYISLLSEKNKNSNLPGQFLGAFVQGTNSNLKGSRNTNYSSLIYIAEPL